MVRTRVALMMRGAHPTTYHVRVFGAAFFRKLKRLLDLVHGLMAQRTDRHLHGTNLSAVIGQSVVDVHARVHVQAGLVVVALALLSVLGVHAPRTPALCQQAHSPDHTVPPNLVRIAGEELTDHDVHVIHGRRGVHLRHHTVLPRHFALSQLGQCGSRLPISQHLHFVEVILGGGDRWVSGTSGGTGGGTDGCVGNC